MCDVKENIFAIKVSLGSANRLSAAKLITGPFLGIISIFASMININIYTESFVHV